MLYIDIIVQITLRAPEFHMIVFLDTEFTSISEQACLMSLGLAAENGELFYVEIIDGWSMAQCSDFVKEIVIPQLKPNEYARSAFQAGLLIVDFLESLGPDVRIATDAPDFDWDFLCQLTFDVGLWPNNVSKHYLLTQNLLTEDERAAYRAEAPHHALLDAQLYVEYYKKSILRTPEDDL